METKTLVAKTGHSKTHFTLVEDGFVLVQVLHLDESGCEWFVTKGTLETEEMAETISNVLTNYLGYEHK